MTLNLRKKNLKLLALLSSLSKFEVKVQSLIGVGLAGILLAGLFPFAAFEWQKLHKQRLLSGTDINEFVLISMNRELTLPHVSQESIPVKS